MTASCTEWLCIVQNDCNLYGMTVSFTEWPWESCAQALCTSWFCGSLQPLYPHPHPLSSFSFSLQVLKGFSWNCVCNENENCFKQVLREHITLEQRCSEFLNTYTVTKQILWNCSSISMTVISQGLSEVSGCQNFTGAEPNEITSPVCQYGWWDSRMQEVT